MKNTCFLVLSEYGIVRMTKRQGVVRKGEVAVKLSLIIANKCFAEPPISAEIVVREGDVIHPAVAVTVEEPESVV